MQNYLQSSVSERSESQMKNEMDFEVNGRWDKGKGRRIMGCGGHAEESTAGDWAGVFDRVRALSYTDWIRELHSGSLEGTCIKH